MAHDVFWTWLFAKLSAQSCWNLHCLGLIFFFELRAMAQNKSKSQHERLADDSSQA